MSLKEILRITVVVFLCSCGNNSEIKTDYNSDKRAKEHAENRRYFDSVFQAKIKIVRNKDSLIKTEPKRIDSLVRLMKANLISSYTLRSYLRNAQTNSLIFLNSFAGLYPSDVSFLEIPNINKRLRRMLIDQYGFLMEFWQVENPIEVENGLLYTDGYMANNCCDPYFIIMADIEKNALYVGILREGMPTIYSPYALPSSMPQFTHHLTPKKLANWADSLYNAKCKLDNKYR